MGSNNNEGQGDALILKRSWGQVHYLDVLCYKAIVMFTSTYT